MKEFIEFIAKKMVRHPEDVTVRVIEGEKQQTFDLHVHPEDVGRIIGKNGKTAKAIRALIGAAAAKANINAKLEISS